MKRLIAAVLGAAAVAAAPAPQTFIGVITDSECADGNHGRMQMGATDPECVQACVEAHGARYVLFDGRTVYELSDQQAPATFAGTKVVVSGSLDAKTRTIHVESIGSAK